MAFAEDRVNDVFPGNGNGLIEAVKTGVIVALRTALTGTSLTSSSNSIHVDMEYPKELVNYPGIWVQFSLNTLRPSGIGMMVEDRESGDTLQQFTYTGRVSLTLVALTSLERDRLADHIISMLAFSRVPNPRLLTENGKGESFSSLYEEFDRNPYVSMTVNSDEPKPGGQSVTVGVPWDETQLAYEDQYSFDVLGEFMLVTTNEGFYRLSRIDIYHEAMLGGMAPPQADPEGWV